MDRKQTLKQVEALITIYSFLESKSSQASLKEEDSTYFKHITMLTARMLETVKASEGTLVAKQRSSLLSLLLYGIHELDVDEEDVESGYEDVMGGLKLGFEVLYSLILHEEKI